MKKLLSFTFVVWVVLGLIIAIVVPIGHGQSLPNQIQRLHLADCALPCWNNIRLGSTKLSQAANRLNEIYGLHLKIDRLGGLEPSSFYLYVKDTEYIRLAIEDTTQSISEFDFKFHCDPKHCNAIPTLGELVQIYGPPTCLRWQTSSYLVYIQSYYVMYIRAQSLSL